MTPGSRILESEPPSDPSTLLTDATPDRLGGAGGLRRFVDVLVALGLLVATSPLLVVAIAWLLYVGGRPIFYAQVRVGYRGRPFRCLKLRTMVVDAERWLDSEPRLKRRYLANGFKLPGATDPRIAPGGHLLRLTYLDELPQLVNVLHGCMSLVGPRPVVPAELAAFGPGVSTLLSVKPGLFGAWTGLGLRRPGYPQRARIEIDYVRRRTALGDVRVLCRNIIGVLSGHPDERARARPHSRWRAR